MSSERNDPATFRVHVDRYPDAALLDIRWPDGGELVFVAAGRGSIGMMVFDYSDELHHEPQIHLVPRADGVDLNLSDEELMLLVWQTMGAPR
jgi:hypothetical protein